MIKVELILAILKNFQFLIPDSNLFLHNLILIEHVLNLIGYYF